MSAKKRVRHVDYSAGDMLTDIGGELTPAEFGVYWMVCTLIYAKRRAIDDDAAWIADKFKRTRTDPRTVRAALDQLIRLEKIARADGKLMVSRCQDELDRASNRIRKAGENGASGGRPRNEPGAETNDINEDHEPGGSTDEKLIPAPAPAPTTNTTTNSTAENAAPPPDVPVLSSPHPGYAEATRRVLEITGGKATHLNRVDAWLRAGADPETDIYPTITDRLSRWRSGSLQFFDGAVRDAIATRLKPLGEGHARNSTAGNRKSGNGWVNAYLKRNGGGSDDVELPGGRQAGDSGRDVAPARSDH